MDDINDLSRRAGELRGRIAEAFAPVAYPGDGALRDGGRQDEETDDVQRAFTGAHWRDFAPVGDLPAGRANPLGQGMCFFSAAAWHFFLPAYLIREIGRADPDVFFLRSPLSSDPYDRSRREHHERRYVLLDAAQSRAVIDVLEWADARLAERQYETRRQEVARALHYWRVWRPKRAAQRRAEPPA